MHALYQTKSASDTTKMDGTGKVAQNRIFVDERPEAIVQHKLVSIMAESSRVLRHRALSNAIQNSPHVVTRGHQMSRFVGEADEVEKDSVKTAEALSAQREEKGNAGGLPAQLKSGIESISGISMDQVKVHYNSSKPAQLNAHAYAHGNEIHLGANQEKFLPHEAWHLVQQAQGRVRPTFKLGTQAVNDEPSLEKEADLMGELAARSGHSITAKPAPQSNVAGGMNTDQLGCSTISTGVPNQTQLMKTSGTVACSVIQPFMAGDLFPLLGGAIGGVLGASVGIGAGIAGASIGSYGADKLRKMINDYRNRDTGYSVSILTTGGATRVLNVAARGMRNGYAEGGSADAVVKGAANSAAGLMGHVSLQLQGNGETNTYDMQSTGVKKIDNLSGSTRETHKITQQQFEILRSRISNDMGRRVKHKFFDLNLLKKHLGREDADTASCAGWIITVLTDAGVPVGTLFDRYVFPVPVLMAQSGWDLVGDKVAGTVDKSSNKEE